MPFDIVYGERISLAIQEILYSRKFGTRILGNSLYSEESIVQALLNSKDRLFFAESGNISGWSFQEQRILGGISVVMKVQVFDDGTWYQPIPHNPPFEATLLFCPGPLLARTDCWDYNFIVSNRNIKEENYRLVLEERILPLLLYVQETAEEPAIITIPGLGCGMFAGIFQGWIDRLFIDTLRSILADNSERLSKIALVYHYAFGPEDPELRYEEDISNTMKFVQWRNGPPLLSAPEAIERTLSEAPLYKVVAWDHFSWPGNDFFANARQTDDGVSSAATSSMQELIPKPKDWEYRYVPERAKFLPYHQGRERLWRQVAPEQLLIPERCLCLT